MINYTRLFTVFFLLTISLLSCGCLQADLMIEFDENGAGSIEASYEVTENAVSQLKAMIKLSQQLESVSLGTGDKPAPPPEIMHFLAPEEKMLRAYLQQYGKYGLKLDRLRVRSANARRSVDLRMEFDDIAEVAKADFFADYGFSLYRRKSGDLLLHRKSMNQNNPYKDPLLEPEAQRLVEPILAGFTVNVKIHTPTRILQTNADSSGVKTATWIFEQDRDPKAFQRLQNQSYMILMDSSGVRIPDIQIVTTPAEGNARER